MGNTRIGAILHNLTEEFEASKDTRQKQITHLPEYLLDEYHVVL